MKVSNNQTYQIKEKNKERTHKYYRGKPELREKTHGLALWNQWRTVVTPNPSRSRVYRHQCASRTNNNPQ